MNIDIESIVREEIRNLIREHLNITSEHVQVTVNDTSKTESQYEYEFPREGKTRRNAEEMALHKEEKLLGRRLTPEEKGEVKAKLYMDDSAENTAKEPIPDRTPQGFVGKIKAFFIAALIIAVALIILAGSVVIIPTILVMVMFYLLYYAVKLSIK